MTLLAPAKAAVICPHLEASFQRCHQVRPKVALEVLRPVAVQGLGVIRGPMNGLAGVSWTTQAIKWNVAALEHPCLAPPQLLPGRWLSSFDIKL